MSPSKFAEYLGLKSPYKIEMVSKKNKNMAAGYWSLYKNGGKGKLHCHVIRVYLGNKDYRDLETLIAHEMIHAWQEENGHEDIHGKSFKKMARKMSKEFDLPHIYIKASDNP